MFVAVGQRLHVRSAALLLSIEDGLPRIMGGWLIVAMLASALRIATSPLHGRAPEAATVLPYVLLIAAPVVSMLLALRWFANGDSLPQPAARLAVVGKWRTVPAAAARNHSLYGTSGIMVSLLIGMLLNVPIRAFEYFATMPALVGPVPVWLTMLHTMMTLDVVLLSSLYTIAFVAALRRAPHFPRLLAGIWVIDLAMQLLIAEVVAGTHGLPATVSAALHHFLDGNIQKVLISAALWLPYLLLSRRVNITYRQRLPA